MCTYILHIWLTTFFWEEQKITVIWIKNQASNSKCLVALYVIRPPPHTHTLGSKSELGDSEVLNMEN